MFANPCRSRSESGRPAWSGMALSGLLLVLAPGCSKSTVTFEMAEVINAWGDANTRKQLDVDIVCLTKEDAEKLPEVVNRQLRSDVWFAWRESGDAKLATIAPARIYALRGGPEEGRGDTKAGPPLASGMDIKDGPHTREVKIEHPQGGEDKAAIVIYGRFIGEGDRPARTEPVVIQPPPGLFGNHKIRVAVGKQSMTNMTAK